MATHLITGAGSGIGAAVAERLSNRGDTLWLLARNAGRATELANRFPGARTLVSDLSEPGRLSWALEKQEQPTDLDSLLHIGGIAELAPIAESTTAMWNATLAANLVAPAELTRLLLPQLRQSGGHVLFVNSGAGLRANPEWGAYAASKHGLKALADALRAEESASGVRVTSVYPGRTATPMQEHIHRYEGRSYDPDQQLAPADVAETVLCALDLPQGAEVTDLQVRPKG